MNRKTVLNSILGVIQTFNGLSGLLGGYMLINDPAGNSLNMKIEWLKETPFQNYLIPGIVLFLVVGIGNTVGIWLTFREKNKRSQIGLIFGLILMFWIISQVLWIGYKDFLQPLYFTAGLLQAVAGFALVKLINNG